MHLQLPSPIPPSHPHAPAATHTHTRIHPPIKTGHAAAHRFPGRGRRGPARAGLVRARARRVECVCVQPPGAHVASAVYASPLPSLPLQHSTHHPPTMNRRSLNSPPQGRDRGLHVPRQLRGGARPRRLCVRRGVCLGAAAAVTGWLIDRHATCACVTWVDGARAAAAAAAAAAPCCKTAGEAVTRRGRATCSAVPGAREGASDARRDSAADSLAHQLVPRF